MGGRDAEIDVSCVSLEINVDLLGRWSADDTDGRSEQLAIKASAECIVQGQLVCDNEPHSLCVHLDHAHGSHAGQQYENAAAPLLDGTCVRVSERQDRHRQLHVDDA